MREWNGQAGCEKGPQFRPTILGLLALSDVQRYTTKLGFRICGTKVIAHDADIGSRGFLSSFAIPTLSRWRSQEPIGFFSLTTISPTPFQSVSSSLISQQPIDVVEEAFHRISDQIHVGPIGSLLG
jgi:hypothetical protein